MEDTVSDATMSEPAHKAARAVGASDRSRDPRRVVMTANPPVDLLEIFSEDMAEAAIGGDLPMRQAGAALDRNG